VTAASATEAFCEPVLDELDRPQFERALHVDGLDQEIAQLRLRLREGLRNRPDDTKLLHAGLRLLVQALLAQRRLSPTQAEHLSDAAIEVIEAFGASLIEAGSDEEAVEQAVSEEANGEGVDE
jgi:type VI protein secretion system component VasF